MGVRERHDFENASTAAVVKQVVAYVALGVALAGCGTDSSAELESLQNQINELQDELEVEGTTTTTAPPTTTEVPAEENAVHPQFESLTTQLSESAIAITETFQGHHRGTRQTPALLPSNQLGPCVRCQQTANRRETLRCHRR